MIVFGPVPSRRLGQSLGINNIPPKSCSYSCIYCQVGRTAETEALPRSFYPPETVVAAVTDRVAALGQSQQSIDFLTFVPDGEPTLDENLGDEIEGLRSLGIPIAVITNASLLWRAEVRITLARADWVSLKVDAVREEVWRRINRPDASLRMETVLDGMRRFAAEFKGELTTETMLIKGINDDGAVVIETADFLAQLAPGRAYLGIPTRPTAESWCEPPDEETYNRAYQVFAARLPDVEYLTGEGGTSFGFTGNVEDDLLGITAVHPMSHEAVAELLRNSHASWDVVEGLLAQGRLKRIEYRGNTFYERPLPHVNPFCRGWLVNRS
ncbi:MAG: radical SAM protein [Proteobacteria bacterium]|nr:radical SAM protein [Pseudomonadota bacterium]